MSRVVWKVGVATVAALLTACSRNHVASDVVPQPMPVRHALEVTTRERWMHAAQRPEFTPFGAMSWAMQLDGPAASADERTLQLSRLDRQTGDTTSLVVRRDGSIVRQATRLGRLPTPPGFGPKELARFAQFRLFDEGRLVLPATRAWDAIPSVHPSRFAVGQRWTDTIALATELDGSRQALDGIRVSVVVKDTAVDGRRLWVVRDSARVRYAERTIDVERTLDTTAILDRTAAGTIKGRYLYDRALGLYWSRADTTSLVGEAVLHYPDARSFRTTARYERTRDWVLREPAAYVAHREAIRLERARTSMSVVITPSNETEQRLARGDTTFRDSLLAQWERDTDPNRRQQTYRSLLLWARSEAFQQELDRRRVVAGDSAFAIERLARLAFPARVRIDQPLAQEMIRVMRDPGIPLAVNVSRDPLYENLAQTFSTWPRALEADTGAWRCSPEACALFEQQFRTADELRLRDVGLTALVTADPARWADSLVGHPRSGSTILRQVTALVTGRQETYPPRAVATIPPPDADWRAWKEWTRGDFSVPLRFHAKRTGRDLVAEIRQRFTTATSDSARLVYGTLLVAFGEPQNVDDAAVQMRSGSQAQRQLAFKTVQDLFGRSGPSADSATVDAVIDHVLSDATKEPGRDSLYVLADSIPPALRARWSNRMRFISAAEWGSMSDRKAARMLSVSRVERVGSFARVRTQTAGRLDRQPNESLRFYYSGATYYMMETNGVWSVVATERWIT